MLPSSIRKKHLKISVSDGNNSNIINNLKNYLFSSLKFFNLAEMNYKQVRKFKLVDDPFYYTFKLKTGIQLILFYKFS